MSRVELQIMIKINKNNIKARRNNYLKAKDENQKIELLKSIIKTNQELNKLISMSRVVA